MTQRKSDTTDAIEIRAERVLSDIERLESKTFSAKAPSPIDIDTVREHVGVEVTNPDNTMQTWTLEEIDGAIAILTAERDLAQARLDYYVALRTKVDAEVEKVKPA